MNQDFFSEVTGPIPFGGLTSTDPLSYKVYDPDRLVGRVPPIAIMRASGWFHVAALSVMAILSLSGVVTWWAIVGPHMVLSFGTGMIVANANAGAIGMYPRLAGTASSLAGLAQMGMGAMGTVTVAILTLIGSRYVAMPLVIGLMPFALLDALAKHDDVDALWCFGAAQDSTLVERLSTGNMKRTFVDHGRQFDWFDAASEGPALLRQARAIAPTVSQPAGIGGPFVPPPSRLVARPQRPRQARATVQSVSQPSGVGGPFVPPTTH